jgi:hypothetical protein
MPPNAARLIIRSRFRRFGRRVHLLHHRLFHHVMVHHMVLHHHVVVVVHHRLRSHRSVRRRRCIVSESNDWSDADPSMIETSSFGMIFSMWASTQLAQAGRFVAKSL